MHSFEKQYLDLVIEVATEGEIREGRNGRTASVFGRSLTFNLDECFPLLQGRKIHYKGVFGELAAMLRQPSCVEDFERWGCNYWKQWADEDGELSLDYGNAWFNFDGVDQIAELKHMLRNDPTSRRMLINSWRPNRLRHLSLPCCHYSYQFYVDADSYLHMVWTQRSADVMVGIPSDAVFAAAWMIAIANEFNMVPGTCKMDFGDTHIYEEHFAGAVDYAQQCMSVDAPGPWWTCNTKTGEDFCLFQPDDIVVGDYKHQPAINFKVKA